MVFEQSHLICTSLFYGAVNNSFNSDNLLRLSLQNTLYLTNIYSLTTQIKCFRIFIFTIYGNWYGIITCATIHQRGCSDLA